MSAGYGERRSLDWSVASTTESIAEEDVIVAQSVPSALEGAAVAGYTQA
jgi:hypothetical protein